MRLAYLCKSRMLLSNFCMYAVCRWTWLPYIARWANMFTTMSLKSNDCLHRLHCQQLHACNYHIATQLIMVRCSHVNTLLAQAMTNAIQRCEDGPQGLLSPEVCHTRGSPCVSLC
eukprot:TRINITY_DN10047_c0_g1_i5.p4 TRINITY_DN10047_c0_g1~~TRINITY_DN10047_c0_g1_i5.p4  ORF type:complete len:115 (+),score=4.38 TRINITY_DN10047_c0_g1_i5:2880-3224(+)